MPWLYPQKSLWTEEDAKKHAELATQAHAAHHAVAHAQTNKLPTVKEDAAKQGGTANNTIKAPNAYDKYARVAIAMVNG